MEDSQKRIVVKNLIDKLMQKKWNALYTSGLSKYDVFLMDFKFGNYSLNTLKNYLYFKKSGFKNIIETLRPSHEIKKIMQKSNEYIAKEPNSDEGILIDQLEFVMKPKHIFDPGIEAKEIISFQI